MVEEKMKESAVVASARANVETIESLIMVERIVEYKCKICGNRYEDLEYALECASKGVKEYPIGCIYGDHRPDAFYEKITFAVAENVIERHMNLGYSWACRDNGRGDSLGMHTCCGNSLHLYESLGYLDSNEPHFIRMVKFLKTTDHQITVWDGTKPILLEQFMELPRKW